MKSETLMELKVKADSTGAGYRDVYSNYSVQFEAGGPYMNKIYINEG